MKALRGFSDPSIAGFNIERIVASFEDKNGHPLLAMTVPQKDIEDYVNGRKSRRQFLGQMDVDISGLIDVNRAQSLIQGQIADIVESELNAEFAVELAVEWAAAKELITVDCPPSYDGDNCNFEINEVEIARHQAGRN